MQLGGIVLPPSSSAPRCPIGPIGGKSLENGESLQGPDETKQCPACRSSARFSVPAAASAGRSLRQPSQAIRLLDRGGTNDRTPLRAHAMGRPAAGGGAVGSSRRATRCSEPFRRLRPPPPVPPGPPRRGDCSVRPTRDSGGETGRRAFEPGKDEAASARSGEWQDKIETHNLFSVRCRSGAGRPQSASSFPPAWPGLRQADSSDPFAFRGVGPSLKTSGDASSELDLPL